jgi:hypothetical protein
MLRTVVLPPHPQPLSQRARGARKTFKVPRPQGEGFRERETPGFELDKVYVALPGDFGLSEKPPSVSVEN